MENKETPGFMHAGYNTSGPELVCIPTLHKLIKPSKPMYEPKLKNVQGQAKRPSWVRIDSVLGSRDILSGLTYKRLPTTK